MTDSAPIMRRTTIIRSSMGRNEMLLLAAGFVLMLILAYAFSGTEPAHGSQHRDKDDLTTVVAAGEDVEGKTSGKNQPSGKSLPQTGVDIDRPLLVGLVLLLDGALALMLSQRRQLRIFTPN